MAPEVAANVGLERAPDKGVLNVAVQRQTADGPEPVDARVTGTVQTLIGQPQPLETFGFGVFEFNTVYQAIPELGVGQFSERQMYELFATAMVDAVAMVHYYFDSFIWKVSDKRVQEGLR